MFGTIGVICLCAVMVLTGIGLFCWAAKKKRNVVMGLAIAALIGGGHVVAQQPDFAGASIRNETKIDWSNARQRVVASSLSTGDLVTDDMWGKAMMRRPSLAVAAKPMKSQMLMFTATWCEHCKPPKNYVMDTFVPRGWTASEEANADFRFVDVDKHPDLMARYEVTKCPTSIIIDRSGKVVERFEAEDQQMSRWAKAMNKYR